MWKVPTTTIENKLKLMPIKHTDPNEERERERERERVSYESIIIFFFNSFFCM